MVVISVSVHTTEQIHFMEGSTERFKLKKQQHAQPNKAKERTAKHVVLSFFD